VVSGKERGPHLPDGLSTDTKGLPACGEYPQARARGEECLREARGSLDQMLAVVHNEQQLFAPQPFEEGTKKRTARLLAHPEGTSHGLRHESRLRERRQLG
jgi:hypothetical protein